MKLRTAAILLLMLSLSFNSAFAEVDKNSPSFKEAVRLYESGLYDSARSRFESLVAEQGRDALAEGYALLCSIRTKRSDADLCFESYNRVFPASLLYPQIYYYRALNFFDNGDWAEALSEFKKVPEGKLSSREEAEVVFKEAYCYFNQGYLDSSEPLFAKVEQKSFNEFKAPSRYALGYISYDKGNFTEACKWFEKAAKDERFKENSEYYMLECRFMQKDYDYVLKNGPLIFEKVPQARKSHLARILSETYLVNGDLQNAQKYFASAETQSESRADLFYVGSLKYATGDYQGAIDSYSKMEQRTDSLGQIAEYNLAYSYIQVKNKVAALESFSRAKMLPYDSLIKEDSSLNYAKLAFDLNKDVSAFRAYLKDYPDTGKNDQIYSYIALASLINHDYAGAVDAYDNIDVLDEQMKGNYMKANYLRATQLIAAGAWSDAVPCLKAAGFYSSRNDNFNKLTRYWLAESYYKSENYPEAQKTFTDLYNNSALDNQAEGRALLYNIAYSSYKQGDYTEAARWFDKYLDGGDGTFRKDAVLRRADCDFIRKDYKAAIDSYTSAVTEFEDLSNLYPHYRLALSFSLLNKVKEEIQVLEKVRGAEPSVPFYSESIYELGRAYVASKQQSEAMDVFKGLNGSSMDSTYKAASLVELGLLSRNAKDNEKALQYYSEVVTDYPGSPYREDALLAIESIYQSNGEPDKYISFIEGLSHPVAKDNDEKEMIYFNSAEQVFLSGNYEKAIAALEKYQTEYPSGSKLIRSWFYSAEAYRNLDNREKACEFYSKVCASQGEDSFKEISTLQLGELSYGMERFSDAYKAYSDLYSGAKLEENKSAALTGMMRSAYKAHSYDNAITAAQAVISAASSDADLKREADFIRAKSLLESSHREEAFAIFKILSQKPSTSEGAEAAYLIIQDTYDKADFGSIEDMVYKFADGAGSQSYWLAKAFIVLGDAFVEKGNFTQAQATFESIVNGYQPLDGVKDDVLDAVNMRIEKLKQMNK